MKNSALTEAKRTKKNEFYTQHKDIEVNIEDIMFSMDLSLSRKLP